MSALDGVLADLVESDRDCAYVTVQRQSLESLIQEWLDRGDQIALLRGLATRAGKELATALSQPGVETSQLLGTVASGLVRELNVGMAEWTALIAHHRHAVRLELAAQLKQALRSAIAEIHTRISEAMLKGNSEVAERLESERQTVQIVIGAIDAMANRLFTRDLAAAAHLQGKDSAPPA